MSISFLRKREPFSLRQSSIPAYLVRVRLLSLCSSSFLSSLLFSARPSLTYVKPPDFLGFLPHLYKSPSCFLPSHHLFREALQRSQFFLSKYLSLFLLFFLLLLQRSCVRFFKEISIIAALKSVAAMWWSPQFGAATSVQPQRIVLSSSLVRKLSIGSGWPGLF